VHEVGGRQLGVAARVPQRRPAQRPRHRVGQPAQVAQHGGQRAVVEAQLGEGGVVVVDQQQVRALRDVELDALAVELHVEAVAADQHVVDQVVEPDGDPVRAEHVGLLVQAQPVAGCPWRGHGAQRADARGLQPGAAPLPQVPPARRLQLGEQVGEHGVAERVPLEVGPHGREEDVLARRWP
jgi:hypothetical protein